MARMWRDNSGNPVTVHKFKINTDKIYSLLWDYKTLFISVFSLDFVFLLYRFRFFPLDFVFLLYRFRFISLDFVFLLYRFRWILFSFCFVSFRFSVYRYPKSGRVCIHRNVQITTGCTAPARNSERLYSKMAHKRFMRKTSWLCECQREI
jgi:hypothetical protein